MLISKVLSPEVQPVEYGLFPSYQHWLQLAPENGGEPKEENKSFHSYSLQLVQKDTMVSGVESCWEIWEDHLYSCLFWYFIAQASLENQGTLWESVHRGRTCRSNLIQRICSCSFLTETCLKIKNKNQKSNVWLLACVELSIIWDWSIVVMVPQIPERPPPALHGSKLKSSKRLLLENRLPNLEQDTEVQAGMLLSSKEANTVSTTRSPIWLSVA